MWSKVAVNLLVGFRRRRKLETQPGEPAAEARCNSIHLRPGRTAPDVWAQFGGSGPMGSIVTKTNETREMLVMIGKAAVGVVAAILFLMALGGRVAWHWVIMVIVAGAGLTGLDAIVNWINA